MAHPISYTTAAMVRDLPGCGVRYETVHGELLMTPSPRLLHQVVLQNLFLALTDYLRVARLGRTLFLSPADISWGDDILVQPDLFVAAADEVSGEWQSIHTLYLVVEVLSPASARADRFTKRRLYQEHRVGNYWVVDIDQRQIEIWTPEAAFPRIEQGAVRWRHPACRHEFVIDWETLLARDGG